MKNITRGYSDLKDTKTFFNLFIKMGLPEYHAKVLSNLVLLGSSKAPRLASSSDVPRSRVYDVLQDLFKMGLVKRKVGKPTIYYPLELSKMTENFGIWLQRKYSEQAKSLKVLEVELKKVKNISTLNNNIDLIRTVQVGAPSELETTTIIKKAEKNIIITTRAFEYYRRAREYLIKASKKGVSIKILMNSYKSMDEKDQEIQSLTIKWLLKDLPSAQIKYSEEVPIRMTIGDTDNNSKAVFIAEQRGVPLLLREAAVTENSSFIKMLNIYFESLWQKAKVTPN